MALELQDPGQLPLLTGKETGPTLGHMRRFLSLSAAAILLAGPASATPWHVMGPRAMGMGGAQTAIAQGPLASYWNPAGLGQLYNSTGFEAVLGVRGEFAGTVLEGANDMFDIREACESGPGGICSQANINEALTKFGQPGNGVLVDGGANASIKVKQAVVFVQNLTYVGMTPEADLVNTNPAFGVGGIDQNQSKAILTGGSFTEFGIGYGHELWETGLVVGGNLKGIVGRVGYDEQRIVAEDADDSPFSDFDDNSETSFRPGVDLGALWDVRETFPSLPMRPRLALVARNVNDPEFDQPQAAKNAGERDKFPLNSQVRAGAALSPLPFWHLAMDVDLSDNLTPVDGMRSRYVSLGTEINVLNRPWLNIPVRAGMQKNISDASNSAWAWSGGFGLHFMHVMLDIGGQVSSQSTRTQSERGEESVPNNVAVSARFAFLFGGADEGARNK